MSKVKYLFLALVMTLVSFIMLGCGKGITQKQLEAKADRYELPTSVLSETGKFQGSFKLDKMTADGIEITWESNSKSITINDGTAKVTFKEYEDGGEKPADEKATLTATFKYKNLKPVKKTFEGEIVPIKVKLLELSQLHNITKAEVETLKNNYKDIKAKVKGVIVAAISTGRIDLVDKDGVNRTLLYLNGKDQTLIPNDIKVGDELNLSAYVDEYYDVLQLSSKTIPTYEITAHNKQDVIKVDESETISKQATVSAKLGSEAIGYLKRDANYSKVVKMTAKVVVTNKDDEKYGVELEDLATGQRVLASYGYIYKELKELNGKIIEFKAITAVDVRDVEDSTKNNADSKITGKYDPRIGVIEILNKDVKENDELKNKLAEQKELFEAYKEAVLKNKIDNIIELKPDSEDDPKKGNFTKATKDGFTFEYKLYNEKDPNKGKVHLEENYIDYLKEAATSLLKITVKKGEKIAEFINGLDLLEPKPVEATFNDLYKKDPNDDNKLLYQGKLVAFEGVIYEESTKKKRLVVKDKENQDNVFEVSIDGAEFSAEYKVGAKVRFVGILEYKYGVPKLIVKKIDKCKVNEQVDNFTPQVEKFDNTKTQADYDALASKVNKKINTTVVIESIDTKDARNVIAKVGEVKITVRLVSKSLKGKLVVGKTYELNGSIGVYKNKVQVSIFNAESIIAK